MQIITRDQWGFSGWLDNSPPARVDLSKRTEFFVHYEGGTPTTDTGTAAVKAIHAYHKGTQKWAGIGYSFIIDQNGQIFEGRGIDYQGAHCPDHNISGFGVQIHIGGDQQPTSAALTACVDLYDHLCRITGKQLAKRGHRDGFATECPGGPLYQWVKAGMPRPGAAAPTLPATGGSTMPKSPNDGGWLLQAGVKDNDQVGASLPILYKYRFDLNQPAIAGRSLDPSDIANLADFQRVVGLVAGQGLDWPTMQALQYYDRISLHWANANPGGLKLDIGATQWALARLGLMGDWDWWSGVGTFGPRTTEAVNRFYEREAAILGKGDGKWGPVGFGLLAHRTGVFKCTTPYAAPAVQPHVPSPQSSSRYVRPIAAGPLTPITQGWDVYNPRYASKKHNGVDIAAPYGAPIFATIGGVVTSYRSEGGYGNRIRVRGDDGLYQSYNHTSALTVRVGSRVKTGQQIGRVGKSGQVTGPHLCMEFYPTAAMTYNTDINPNRWP